MQTKQSTETPANDTFKLSDLSEQDLENLLAAKKKQKENQRETYKTLVVETVPEVIAKLAEASEMLSHAKMDTFSRFKELLQLKNEVFSVKKDDKPTQQSHTFSDDKSSVTIGYRVNEGWDDTAATGIKKVTDFLESLAKDTNSAALVKTVFNLLKQDSKGNLRASRVVELQKLTSTFNNAEFSDGVNIIANAYTPVRSVWFIEATTTNGIGEKVSIPLSMSAVDFPDGFTFDFFDNDSK